MNRLTKTVPAALVVLGLVISPMSASAATDSTAAETWLLRATWGKPPSWFTVSRHPTKDACEVARVEYRKTQQLGQYSGCVLK
jgi:hypothetical protein